MENKMDNKLSQLNDLKNFINEKETQLKNLLKQLNWEKEDEIKEFNTNLKTKPSEIQEKVVDSKSLPWKNLIVIDDKILQEILGNDEKSGIRSHKLLTELSREQKLTIYEYVIAHTTKLSEPELSVSVSFEEMTKNKKTPSTSNVMTFAEIVAMKRDMKRRRQKYHLTKLRPLSQTEEIRNLIELQMQALLQYRQNDNKEGKESKSYSRRHSRPENIREKRDDRYKSKKSKKKKVES